MIEGAILNGTHPYRIKCYLALPMMLHNTSALVLATADFGTLQKGFLALYT